MVHQQQRSAIAGFVCGVLEAVLTRKNEHNPEKSLRQTRVDLPFAGFAAFVWLACIFDGCTM